jgi:hypothetical protein
MAVIETGRHRGLPLRGVGNGMMHKPGICHRGFIRLRGATVETVHVVQGMDVVGATPRGCPVPTPRGCPILFMIMPTEREVVR